MLESHKEKTLYEAFRKLRFKIVFSVEFIKEKCFKENLKLFNII